MLDWTFLRPADLISFAAVLLVALAFIYCAPRTADQILAWFPPEEIPDATRPRMAVEPVAPVDLPRDGAPLAPRVGPRGPSGDGGDVAPPVPVLHGVHAGGAGEPDYLTFLLSLAEMKEEIRASLSSEGLLEMPAYLMAALEVHVEALLAQPDGREALRAHIELMLSGESVESLAGAWMDPEASR